jgi:hypothetical protein
LLYFAYKCDNMFTEALEHKLQVAYTNSTALFTIVNNEVLCFLKFTFQSTLIAFQTQPN